MAVSFENNREFDNFVENSNSMKSRIRYSRYVVVLTTIILVALYIGCMATLREKPAFFTVLALFIVTAVLGLLYGPMYIKATPDYVVMGSLLKSRKILVRDIESVELFKPTLGAIRIFASGGFMGYWGIFKEGDIGRYYGFYGKASDCFLVRMRNGDKYVLGCENPGAMVDYIKSQQNH